MNNTAANLTDQKVIGILALQGDYDAHRKMLSEKLSTPSQYVRTVSELEQVDALILPGGESTTIFKLMERIGLDKAIVMRIQAGMPVYGTCAGMILLSQAIEGRPDQPTLAAMRITVARNSFGRQIDSFEADIPFEYQAVASQNGSSHVASSEAASSEASSFQEVSKAETQENDTRAEADGATIGKPEASVEAEVDTVRGVFIRAPYVTEAASDVRILSHFRDRIVGVRQGNLLATAFHPELTDDARVHAYFLGMVNDSNER